MGAEVVAIMGPTASGKTAVAQLVADALGTEVVSADALQVYRRLPILTAQPARRTRLVAIREPKEEMSVGEYERLAHAAIDELVNATGHAVVTGGTGLYLRAAIGELRIPPAPRRGVRTRWEREVGNDPAAAHALLQSLDPRAAEAVHPNDTRRLVRALELAEAGTSLVPEESALWAAATRRPTLVVGLDVPPHVLAARIQARSEQMFADGVVAEVRAAVAEGVSRTAEQALGLTEIATLPPEAALERLVARTRQYAAYQRKWMRRVPGLALVDGDRVAEEVADAVLEMARAR